jgi:hypothetical protein
MIHRRAGVALAPVTDGWYRTGFTWGPAADRGRLASAPAIVVEAVAATTAA